MLLYDFVVIVTHELAHLLEASGGHGQRWRDTHMALLGEIYSDAIGTSKSAVCLTCCVQPENVV